MLTEKEVWNKWLLRGRPLTWEIFKTYSVTGIDPQLCDYIQRTRNIDKVTAEKYIRDSIELGKKRVEQNPNRVGMYNER